MLQTGCENSSCSSRHEGTFRAHELCPDDGLSGSNCCNQAISLIDPGQSKEAGFERNQDITSDYK
jgi:hypothetical protein